MIVLLICTEGVVSEPVYIRALTASLTGQLPASTSRNTEVLPLPLGGNQGHVKLIETAEKTINDFVSNSWVGLADKDDTIEKWIIVDYDDMHLRGVDVEQLRQDAGAVGYTLVVNKPNFEFFVLASLTGIEVASGYRQERHVSEINKCITSLNTENAQSRGFTKGMMMPMYSKKTHIASKLFGGLLGNHPEFATKAMSIDVDTSAPFYTEMPIIIRRINDLYK